MTDRLVERSGSPDQSLYHYLSGLLGESAVKMPDLDGRMWDIRAQMLQPKDLWPLSEQSIITIARPADISPSSIVVAFSTHDLPHNNPFAAFCNDETDYLGWLDPNELAWTKMPTNAEVREAVGQSTSVEGLPQSAQTAMRYIAKKLILC